MDFDKHTVLITGGASGMGAATAESFALAGATVYVFDINPLSISHKNINYIHCNVSSYEEVKNSTKIVLQNVKSIDHLFINAGVLLSASIIDSSIEDINKTIATNINGALYTLKCVLPIMVKQNHGNVVLMGSDQSFVGKKDNSIYGCTKAAIAQLTKSLAIEYALNNIRVNCICPGTIDTPFTRNAIQAYAKRTNSNPQDIFAELVNEQPVKRLGKPTEIANLVLFLCSDLCLYMTGALIPVDGGYTAK